MAGGDPHRRHLHRHRLPSLPLQLGFEVWSAAPDNFRPWYSVHLLLVGRHVHVPGDRPEHDDLLPPSEQWARGAPAPPPQGSPQGAPHRHGLVRPTAVGVVGPEDHRQGRSGCLPRRVRVGGASLRPRRWFARHIYAAARRVRPGSPSPCGCPTTCSHCSPWPSPRAPSCRPSGRHEVCFCPPRPTVPAALARLRRSLQGHPHHRQRRHHPEGRQDRHRGSLPLQTSRP